MPKTLQFRRGTTDELSTIRGSEGELFVDSTKETIVVMDGQTNGGFPLAKESDLVNKQDALISGVNIKAINGQSLLGSGNITISGGSGGNTGPISYNSLIDTPAISAVGHTGHYTDLINYPNITVVATTGSYNDLTDRPNIPTDISQLTDLFDRLGETGETFFWNQIIDAPTLATVATTGSYIDLSDKPTINIPTLSSVATSGSYNDLSNIPTLANVALSGSYHDLLFKPTLANVATSGSYADITGKPSLSNVAISGSYIELLNKPVIPTIPTNISYFVNDSDYISNSHLSWSGISGKPSFATVATSGSYLDLSSKPTMSTVGQSGLYSDLLQKPVLANVALTGSYTNLSNTPNTLSHFTNDLGFVDVSQVRNSISLAGGEQYLHYDNVSGEFSALMPNTDVIPEGNNNLFYSNTRSRSAISGGTGIDYLESDGIISIDVNFAQNFVANAFTQYSANIMNTVPGLVSSLAELQSAIANTSGSNTDIILTSLGNKLRVDDIQVLTTTDKSNVKTSLGLSNVAFSGSYSDLTSKPTIPTSVSQLTNDYSYANNWSNLTGKPTLSNVAIAGTYASLNNKPTFATVATSGSYADLSNTPTIPTLLTQLTNDRGFITASSLTWSGISGKPSFATVATSGSYADLTGKPALANVATSGSYADLYSKPSFATVATSGSYADLTAKPTFANVATSGSYTDLLNKPTNISVFTNDRGYITNTSASIAWTSITGRPTLSNVATTGSYTSLLNRPTIPTDVSQLSDSSRLLSPFPANNVGFLTNDGTGVLSWNPLATNTTMSAIAEINQDFTLNSTHDNTVIPCGDGVIITVPNNLPASFAVVLIQLGSVPITLNPAPGVSVVAPEGFTTNLQYDSIGIIKLVDGSLLAAKSSGASGQQYLSSLSDVNLSTLTTNQVLTYDGTKWVNGKVPSPSLVKTQTSDGAFPNVGHILANFNTSSGVAATYDVTSTGLVTVHWPSHGFTNLQNGMGITLITEGWINHTTNPLGVPMPGDPNTYYELCNNFTYIDANTFTCQTTLNTSYASNLNGLPLAKLGDGYNSRGWVATPGIKVPGNSLGPNGRVDLTWSYGCFNSYSGGGPQVTASFGQLGSWVSMRSASFIWSGSQYQGSQITNANSISDTSLYTNQTFLQNVGSTSRQFRQFGRAPNSPSTYSMYGAVSGGFNYFTTQHDTTQDTYFHVGAGFSSQNRPEWVVIFLASVIAIYGA